MASSPTLRDRVGADRFSSVAIDAPEVASAEDAAQELAHRGPPVDLLILNAGASGQHASTNSDGVETTYASTLVGHHVLTMRLLEHGLLAPGARIIIAGSEGARGNLPGMPLHDIRAIAADHYGGDMAAAIQALMHLDAPAQTRFNNMGEYVTAKLIVAWWAAGLAKHLPPGVTVNAVSPGAAVGSNFARDASAPMRLLIMPIMKLLGPALGMNGSVADAAERYLQAANFTGDQNGDFWATAHPKKLVGPLGIQTTPAHFLDADGPDAALAALAAETGVAVPHLAVA